MTERVSRYSTIVDIKGVIHLGKDNAIVRAYVPGWGSYGHDVQFPLKDVPEDLRDSVKRKSVWKAEVNLAAKKFSKLKPSKFKLLPPLPADFDIFNP